MRSAGAIASTSRRRSGLRTGPGSCPGRAIAFWPSRRQPMWPNNCSPRPCGTGGDNFSGFLTSPGRSTGLPSAAGGPVRSTLIWLALVGAVASTTVSAHHSFAVFFDDQTIIDVTGAVTEFRFTNPHAVISFSVKNAKGQIEPWRAETNAVTLLRRRGWTRDSLTIGEVVTIEGWR